MQVAVAAVHLDLWQIKAQAEQVAVVMLIMLLTETQEDKTLVAVVVDVTHNS